MDASKQFYTKWLDDMFSGKNDLSYFYMLMHMRHRIGRAPQTMGTIVPSNPYCIAWALHFMTNGDNLHACRTLFDIPNTLLKRAFEILTEENTIPDDHQYVCVKRSMINKNI
jgi:hypothetical protein